MDDISKKAVLRALDEVDEHLIKIHALTDEGSKASRQVKELRILHRRLLDEIKSNEPDSER